jgi:DNA-binding NarL/FixJ family response regulator
VPSPRLTVREMDVLRLVARGLNNRDIARELVISENTVKNHVRNILEKLQLHSRMEAVVYAVREKLLEIT